MHNTQQHTQSPAAPPRIANIPLSPDGARHACVIVHGPGRASSPPEGLQMVFRFSADGQGGWIAAAMADAHGYTDSRFDELSFDLNSLGTDVRQVRRNAFSGTASAMAVAGIPQTMEPGQSMIGGGVGHYRGQTAFAIGASTTFSGGRGVVKAGATFDTHGKGGFSAGAGFGF